MPIKIRPNDVVLHRPTGETWVVAGVNQSKNQLVPMGYPFPSIGKLSDCELLEIRYPDEYQSKSVIKAFRDRGMESFIDRASELYHENKED